MVTGTRTSWLTILLVVSVGLNLFLGGLFAGHWYAGRPGMVVAPGGSAETPGRGLLQRMIASLPAEERPAFEAVVAKRRPQVTQAVGEVRAARQTVREALLREPLDRPALDTAFAELRRRNDALQATIQATIAEAAAGLSPAARRRLADWRMHGRGP